VSRPHCVLFAILLCSCTAPTGAGEGGELADWGRLPFWDRSNSLVEHTFRIMETRAERSELREIQRDRDEKAERYRKVREMDRAGGVRVCEEGEHGTRWLEGVETCWCGRGIRFCTEPGGFRAPPPTWPFVSSDDSERTFEQPPRDYREIYQSMSRRRCKEEEIGTYWQWGCNTCWCAGGGPCLFQGRLPSRAMSPSAIQFSRD
jgi:hypothetical protein